MRVDTGRLRVVPVEIGASDPPATDNGLPSPGLYIREQRTHQGMSLAELSGVTNIPVQSLELLEEDRFEELPGPVFVKGFLRCCARSLGLEQEKILELLYERERAITRARRREQRPVTGNHAAPPRRSDARAPRSVAPGGRSISRMLSSLTATNLLLWLVVALFVAVLVMAAFNLGSDVVSGSLG
jgi:cytoskeletal protein RodZ